MPVKRARFYDLLALLTAVVVIVVDQWTKALVVKNLSFDTEVPFPVIGHYLVLRYIRNSGAAFSMFSSDSGPIILAVLIFVAIFVVGYLYARMLNTGPLAYKLIFGLIIGGACGNLLDRVIHGGSVVDFISFRIPEIHFYFAIFNVADACISVGVCLLFLFVLFGGFGRTAIETEESSETDSPAKGLSNASAANSRSLHSTEQDV